MSCFFPPVTKLRYIDCVICKRFVSVGHTELLFMDGDEEVRFFEDEARVSFVAIVTQSDDDPKFGFFKRPNKVEVL